MHASPNSTMTLTEWLRAARWQEFLRAFLPASKPSMGDAA